MKKYEKEIFDIMIENWAADNADTADGLEISEPYWDEELGWVADAKDDKISYSLVDDGYGNIMIVYDGAND